LIVTTNKFNRQFFKAWGFILSPLWLLLFTSCSLKNHSKIGSLTLDSGRALGKINGVKGINKSTDGITTPNETSDCLDLTIEYSSDFRELTRKSITSCSDIISIRDVEDTVSFRATQKVTATRTAEGPPKKITYFLSESYEAYYIDPNYYLTNDYYNNNEAELGTFLVKYKLSQNFYTTIYIGETSRQIQFNANNSLEINANNTLSKIFIGRKSKMCNEDAATSCDVTAEIYNNESNRFDNYHGTLTFNSPLNNRSYGNNEVKLNLFNAQNEHIGQLEIDFDDYKLTTIDLNGNIFRRW
jgi:hypothetical protein